MTLIKKVKGLFQNLRLALSGRGEESIPDNVDKLELYLLNLVKKTLKVKNLYVSDDFFDLGVTSLAAHELAVSISKALGNNIGVSTLLNASSVLALKELIRTDFPEAAEKAFGKEQEAKLSHHQPARAYENMIGNNLFPDDLYQQQKKMVMNWSGEIKSKSGFVIGRNVKGGKTPLLWCCQGELEFQYLADRVGPNQPIYAMRSGFNIFDAEKNPELTGNLAEFYLKEVRSIIPEGSTTVAGNCQASFLAMNIADSIHSNGKKVCLVLLNFIVSKPCPYAVHIFLGEKEEEKWVSTVGNNKVNRIKEFPLSSYDRVTGEHGDYFHETSNFLDKMKAYLETL